MTEPVSKQPTRSKRVTAERRFDKTQLRISGHGRIVHRDYAAHVLRWRFVANQVSYLNDIFFKYGWTHRQLEAGLSILDIGCGQDQPLLYVIGARKDLVPECYLGIDLNRIMKKSHVRWAEIWDEFDFVNHHERVLAKYTPFDVAVCFEVIEHMAPADGDKLLAGIFECLRPGGVAYISTPVFNGLAAANHIHEHTVSELQMAVERAGFKVEKRIGTFASKPDVKAACAANGEEGKRHWQTYQELEHWFGGDVMSTFLSALYPDSSRNNLWILVKPLEKNEPGLQDSTMEKVAQDSTV